MSEKKAAAPTSSSIGRIERADELGDAWHSDAAAAWSKALDGSADGEGALERYDAPPLPDFAADAPAHVRREIFGAYVVDSDQVIPVVHSIAGAREGCAIDAIPRAVFVHFWREVAAAAPNAVAHAPCVAGIE